LALAIFGWVEMYSVVVLVFDGYYSYQDVLQLSGSCRIVSDSCLAVGLIS